jgi:GNAT superfamily N-acetyltransferase
MTTSTSASCKQVRDPVAEPVSTDVRVRRIQPADSEGLREFYSALSAESRRRRFLSISTRFGDGESRYLCGPDHDHREGYVAEVTGASRKPQIVGHVCMEPCGPHEMEIAIAVADRFQGQGIGRRLTHQAIGWAEAHGIQRVLAWSAWDNSAIRRLVESLHRPIRYGPSSGVVETIIELQPPLGTLDAA